MYNDNKRLALNVFWLVLGAVLLVLSIAEVLKEPTFAGMGGALMGVGGLRLAMTFRYRKDPAYRTKIDTKVTDERNAFLRLKSWTWTGTIVVIAEAVGSVVAMIVGQKDLQLMLSYQVCLMLVVYWISFLVLSRKY